MAAVGACVCSAEEMWSESIYAKSIKTHKQTLFKISNKLQKWMFRQSEIKNYGPGAVAPSDPLENQMWIHPLLKIVPNKYTFSSCLFDKHNSEQLFQGSTESFSFY